MAFRKTLAQRFLHLARTHLRPTGPTRKHPPEPDLTGVPILDRIRVLSPERIRLDGLLPPPTTIHTPKPDPETKPNISVAEVRKLLRAAQMETARSRLREMRENCVSYPEFLRICCEASNTEQGSAIGRSLDESGAVVVLGNIVFLRPDQVIFLGSVLFFFFYIMFLN